MVHIRKSTMCGNFSPYLNFQKRCSHKNKIYTVMSNANVVSFKFVPTCGIRLLIPVVTLKTWLRNSRSVLSIDKTTYFKVSSYAGWYHQFDTIRVLWKGETLKERWLPPPVCSVSMSKGHFLDWWLMWKGPSSLLWAVPPLDWWA